jgi:hypothetical protein
LKVLPYWRKRSAAGLLSVLAALPIVFLSIVGAQAETGAAPGAADLDKALGHCTSFATANAKYISTPAPEFSSCVVSGLLQSTQNADGAALVGLMAATEPAEDGQWGWFRPDNLKAVLGASQDAQTLSWSIRAGMNRCGAGESYAAISQSITSVEDGVVAAPLRDRARAHCVSAMKTHSDQVPHPDAMCGCLLDEIDARFTLDEATAVIGAMADDPSVAGHWREWTKPVALAVAGNLSPEAARALSQKVRQQLGPKTQRECAAAKPSDASASSAQAEASAGRKLAQCTDKSCFSDKFSRCQPATYVDSVEGLGAVQLEILGDAEADAAHCRIRLQFSDTPNPAWVGKPLTMTLERGQPFEPQYKSGLNACLTADGADAYECAGPLLDLAGR